MEALSILVGIALGMVGSIPAITLVWLVTRRPVINGTWRVVVRDDHAQIEGPQ